MDQLLSSKLSIMLLETVVNKQIPANSAMSIIAKGMELMETFPNMNGPQKQTLLMTVIEKVAAGSDGIIGTADDILCKETVDTLRLILEKNLLTDITHLITDTAKGKFNINKTIELAQTAHSVCLPLLTKCFKK
jgi:hypothetical protein